MRCQLLLLLPALVLAGCGSGAGSGASTPNPNAPEANPAGDIPDNQAYVRYTPPGGGYSVKVPEGWARTAAGGAVTFTDKLNSIRMDAAAAGGARRVPSGAQQVKVMTVHRTAGTATEVAYLARSQPDAVTGKTRTDAVERYTFPHQGKAVVLTLSGPKGADNVDPWRIVTDSLRFTR
jgi:hypothetical protein